EPPEVASDAEQELEGEEPEQHTRHWRRVGSAAPAEPRGHDRYDGEDGQGARPVEREPARVGHERAKDDLEVHDHRGGERQRAAARPSVKSPTAAPISRWLCS